MDEANRTGLPCSVSLLGGHAQVDTLVFTQECLHTRMLTLPLTLQATPLFFMLCTQLDTAVHVLVDCTRLRQLTERLTNKWFQRGE